MLRVTQSALYKLATYWIFSAGLVFFLVYCQEATSAHANAKILQKVITSPNLRVQKWGTPPTVTCKSGQECSALLSLPQSSTAMPIAGAQQYQFQHLPPSTPLSSAGLHRLKDQEAEGPGRLICTWVRGQAKVGNGWESAALLGFWKGAAGRGERCGRSLTATSWSMGPLVMVCRPTCRRGGWKRRLPGVHIFRIKQEDSPELEGDWTFVVPGMQCWVEAVVEVGCRSV